MAVLPCTVLAGGGPRDVAVVINGRSAVSRDIGRYYQQARGIPESNILNISCPDQETINGDDYERWVAEPLRQLLAKPEIAGRIDYIVVTKGIPLRVYYPARKDTYSLTSVLACLDNPSYADTFANPYGPTAWVTWGALAPEVAWSHSLTFKGKHFYCVTRLDAFNLEQVKALIDRSKRPAGDGSFILDRNALTNGAYGAANDRLGDLSGSAYRLLLNSGHEVVFDGGTGFIANQNGLMGYFSWASNDSAYTYKDYVSNQFLPGSIGDSYYSYSGRTFTDPGTPDRGSLIADLIPQGLCGAGGYVSEPMVTTATYPTILFDRYTKGYNAAESFLAASPQLFWKTVVVADPLMAPYATPPSVSVDIGDGVLGGVVELSASASDDSGISEVKFYFDDELVATATQEPYSVLLDTTRYAIGAHTVEAIAYENSPRRTQGLARASVVVDNLISVVSRMSDILPYADGQHVHIKGKVVTAGSAEIGDGFYMEEADRSSGLRVASSEPVSRGDVVTVSGVVSTLRGERFIDSYGVTITGSVSPPSPLTVRLGDLGGSGMGLAPAVGRGCGARNVSLLVRVAGRVVEAGVGEFLLSDGSEDVPVRVMCPGVEPPAPGSYVAVTGISTTCCETPPYAAAIRVRTAADVQLLGP